MNIQARTELMAVLCEISKLVPFYRLGQLLLVLAEQAEVPYQNVIADIEDEELLPVAREFLEAMKRLPPESIAEQIRAHLESDALVAQNPATAS